MKNKIAAVVWFTGLPSAGKSTLAEALSAKLLDLDIESESLDGDIIRSKIPNIGFSTDDRINHIKRIGLTVSLLEKHGVFSICSFVSPHREARDFVRSLCQNFIEIYVATPLQECQKRDVKGLYQKAKKGEILNLTGVGAEFEAPINPEILIDTSNRSVSECIDEIIKFLKNKKLI